MKKNIIKSILILMLILVFLLTAGCTHNTGEGVEGVGGKDGMVDKGSVSTEGGMDMEGSIDAEKTDTIMSVDTRSDEAVIVVLIDTGISTVAIDDSCVLPGYNYVLKNKDTEDRINHGTAIASLIAGCESAGVKALAPEAKLVPLVIADKVEGETKGVTHTVLAQAVIDAVDKYKGDIINISLGIKTDSPELKSAVEYAEQKGVLVVSAVGNEGYSDDLYYPAAYETVLAVGSCDENGKESDFSQKNNRADVLAPGENIWMASRNGKTYGAKGTSYATGYISGKAAELLKEKSNMNPAELRTLLKSPA